jgi:hypothetical protein
MQRAGCYLNLWVYIKKMIFISARFNKPAFTNGPYAKLKKGFGNIKSRMERPNTIPYYDCPIFCLYDKVDTRQYQNRRQDRL